MAWNLQEILVSREEFVDRAYHILAQVETVLRNGELTFGLLLSRIEVSESDRIECRFHQRIFELDYVSVLLYVFRFRVYAEYCRSILFLDIFPCAFPYSKFLRLHQLDLFYERHQISQCVGFHIVDIEVQRIRLGSRIIDPYFNTIILLLFHGDVSKTVCGKQEKGKLK